MEFNEVQNGVLRNADRYSKKHGILIDEEYAIHKLYEEVGEFSQAWLIHNRKCRESKFVTKTESKAMLANEIADIVGLAIIVADRLNIDLEKAINEKMINKVKK